MAAPKATLPPKASEVPFNSSIISIALVSVVSPVATILYALHSINSSTTADDDVNDAHFFRHLQEGGSCIVSVPTDGQNQTTVGEESTIPDSTWSAIATTSFISLSVGLFCYWLFEIYPRDPIVGKYVYDRKRLSQPDRTPPPLMLSRSLWKGNEDEDRENSSEDATGHGLFSNANAIKKRQRKRACFNVPPALFELFFLTLDENYIRYSQAADDARKAREKSGIIGCCRRGWYHDNCCNDIRRPYSTSIVERDGEIVDEDGYVYFPGYNHDYAFIHEGENHYEIPRFSPRNRIVAASASPRVILAASKASPKAGGSPDSNNATKCKRSIEDLFPEDFRTTFASSRDVGATRALMAAEGSSGNISTEGNPIDLNGEVADNSEVSHDATAESGRNGSAVGFSDLTDATPNSGLITGKTLGVGDFSGHTEQMNTTANCKSSDDEDCEESFVAGRDQSVQMLNLQTSDDDQTDTSLSEERAGRIGHENATVVADNLVVPSRFPFGDVEEGQGEEDDKEVNEVGTDAATDPLVYPWRAKTFFLPPGFHDWGNAWDFLAEFFYIPVCSRYCKLAKQMLSWGEDSTSQDGRNRESVFRSVSRAKKRFEDVPLSPSEHELLRCAGLDTYLMIRFARFGFDVCFYPFCFACVTVLPVYLSVDTESIFKDETTEDGSISSATVLIDGFFSLTINRIKEGSHKMIWILLFNMILYLFVLRRLWVEWSVAPMKACAVFRIL